MIQDPKTGAVNMTELLRKFNEPKAEPEFDEEGYRLTNLPLRGRHTDPSTAKPGAKNNIEDQRRIIGILRKVPEGMNSRELSEALGRPRECISTCLRPMARLGLIREFPKRYDPVSNCTVIVWGL